MRAALLHLVERIEAVGLERIGAPRIKHLRDKLWEMRLSGRDGIARAIYVTAIGRRIIVVHAFVKKTQKNACRRVGSRATPRQGDQAMTSLAELRQQLLADPEVKAEYDRLGPIFAVAGEMIEARHAAGLTQAEVAARMGTSQSVVARLENARHMPTINLITRYAAAVGRRLDIHLVPSIEEQAA